MNDSAVGFQGFCKNCSGELEGNNSNEFLHGLQDDKYSLMKMVPTE